MEALTGPIKQFEELDDLALAEGRECLLLGDAQRLIDLAKQRQAAAGDAAEDLAPVGRTAFARHEVLLFQAIDQTGDAGRVLDHPLRDLERRQSLLSPPAQDP